MLEENKELFINCNCHAPEHILRFTYWPWEEDESDKYAKLIDLDIFLESPSFFRRVWRGVKYIFGFKTKYGSGHFTEIILNKDSCKKMIDFFNETYDYSK